MNYTPLTLPKDIEVRDSKGRYLKGAAQETNKNGTAGHPTKYDPSLVDRVEEYIAWVKTQQNELIGVEGFAAWLGTSDENLVNWANKRLKDEKGEKTKKLAYPDFFTAIKRLKALQKHVVMSGAFFGKANAYMGVFILKANHGLVEPQHMDITSKGKEIQGVPAQPILQGGTKDVLQNVGH